jgi:WD40 repeat protein
MENLRPSAILFIIPVLLVLSVPACSSFPRISGAPAVFRPPTEVARYPGAVTRVSFSPDGRRLAAGGSDNTVRVYRAETWDEEGTVGTNSPYIRDVGWSPTGERLAVVTNEGLHVYGFPPGKEIRFIGVNPPPGPGGPAVSVANPPEFLWSPGGDRIALSGFDNAVVRVYSGAALEDEVVLKGHYRAVTSMTWDPEGRLYTASWDGTVRRWDAATGKWEFLTPNLGPGNIRLARLDSIGALATMAYGDMAVLAWDTRGGKLREKVMSSTPLVLFRPSGDSRMMALADTERSIRIRGIPGWDTSRVLTAEGTVEECRWSPDGRHLAGRAAGDAAVTVWDVATGGAVRLWTREDDMISMDWSPDGRRLITGSRKGKIREWTLLH